MKIEQNYSLEKHNTFNIKAKTRWFIEYESEDDLLKVLNDEYFHECLSIHIGKGSNMLFVNDFDGIIIHSGIKGHSVIEETGDYALVRIGASETWDDIVEYAVSMGWGGIENLSGIPGEAGAAVVQNIGAYGVEIKDVVYNVEAYNQLTFEKKVFTNEECCYSYRNSFFKDKKNVPYIITYVTLRLSNKHQFKLEYGNLSEFLKERDLSLQAVRDAVIEIRNSKIPNYKLLGNAGSFFMNPVVSSNVFGQLKNKYPDIPSYKVTDDNVKIPAAWLIEQCGFKGQKSGNVGIYDKHALIIVNYGGATGEEIATFADKIQEEVKQKFDIDIIPEVRYIQ
jgi:UDP-N-acetylmuramate dehydrogenase